MPSNYNEDTGMIETLRERYQREVREMLELGIIESPLYSPEDDLMFEGDLDDLLS